MKITTAAVQGCMDTALYRALGTEEHQLSRFGHVKFSMTVLRDPDEFEYKTVVEKISIIDCMFVLLYGDDEAYSNSGQIRIGPAACTCCCACFGRQTQRLHHCRTRAPPGHRYLGRAFALRARRAHHFLGRRGPSLQVRSFPKHGLK
jgi:hypothetical protein